LPLSKCTDRRWKSTPMGVLANAYRPGRRLPAQALPVGPVAAPFNSQASVSCSHATREPFQRNPTCWSLVLPQD
jgi:hypothetical protein